MPFNINVLISFIISSAYSLYSYFILKNTPQLNDILTLMLASVAIGSAVLFIIDLLNNKKSLGDYKEHKYIFFLGSFAIIWVSVQTIFEKFIIG